MSRKGDESDTDSDDEDMKSIVTKGNIVFIEQKEIQNILQKRGRDTQPEIMKNARNGLLGIIIGFNKKDDNVEIEIINSFNHTIKLNPTQFTVGDKKNIVVIRVESVQEHKEESDLFRRAAALQENLLGRVVSEEKGMAWINIINHNEIYHFKRRDYSTLEELEKMEKLEKMDLKF